MRRRSIRAHHPHRNPHRNSNGAEWRQTVRKFFFAFPSPAFSSLHDRDNAPRAVISAERKSASRFADCYGIYQTSGWRPGPESNRRTRICSPLRNHSATGPSWIRLPHRNCPRLRSRLGGREARAAPATRLPSIALPRPHQYKPPEEPVQAPHGKRHERPGRSVAELRSRGRAPWKTA